VLLFGDPGPRATPTDAARPGRNARAEEPRRDAEERNGPWPCPIPRQTSVSWTENLKPGDRPIIEFLTEGANRPEGNASSRGELATGKLFLPVVEQEPIDGAGAEVGHVGELFEALDC